MKRAVSALIAVGAIAATAVPAFAQPGYGYGQGRGPGGYGPPAYGQANGWQGINARQAELEQRIEQGVRNGQLTPSEATRLRAEFRAIAEQEARYRATGGLDANERAELDRRFDALASRIQFQRRDDGRVGMGSGVNSRQRRLDQRIDLGVRNGTITRSEAARLQAEFRSLDQLEARYRASGGLSPQERADLNRRLDALQIRVRTALHDRDFRWDDNDRFR